jgi:rhomboid protease GluP
MNNAFQTKLRLLFIPYLYYCVGIVCIYTFLNWLLFTRLQLWLLQEEIRNIWIPFALPWIPLAIGYPRRLKLLKYREKAKSPVFGMVILLGFTIIAPLIIAQFYLSTAAVN